MFSGTIHQVLFTAALLFLASVFAGPAIAQKLPAGKTEYYFSMGKKASLDISKNQIGILPRGMAGPGQLTELAKKYNLNLAQNYSGRVLIYNLPDSAKRGSIVQLARNIRAGNPALVARAGLVARHQTSTIPVVISDEFIVQFKPNVTKNEIDQFNQANGVEIADSIGFAKNQFLLRVTGSSGTDALDMANHYRGDGKVAYSHPDFSLVVQYHGSFTPNDFYFPLQWQFENTGQSGGAFDADIDAPQAWGITKGSVIIAVIDDGFDMSHPDLAPNLWNNPNETLDEIDNDGNGYVDDIHGFDFDDNDGDPSPTRENDIHGTAVAGLAAARGNNSIGISGACPNCSLMLLRATTSSSEHTKAINYAKSMGAHVLNNSWGLDENAPMPEDTAQALNDAAATGRNGLGTVIIFAMSNEGWNSCAGTYPALSSLPSVIAVGGSSNQDRRVLEGSYGPCIDVLAPTYRGAGKNAPYSGTLNSISTDRSGPAGYNNSHFTPGCPGPEPIDDRSYTKCFAGNSAAAPLVAGAAGLLLSVDNTLSKDQVQRFLQDTTDKIHDTIGLYSAENGFSQSQSPFGNIISTHGYGRINAFEAVRIAAPESLGGKDGVDTFMRDNRLDWGNTEQPSSFLFEPVRDFIPHWESVDIKVDAPPYQTPPKTNDEFEEFVHENASSGKTNKVYVRVRNRGPRTSDFTTLRLYWAYAGAGLPNFPADFWSSLPGASPDTAAWHPADKDFLDVAYSGSSVANTDLDAAQIVSLDFQGPEVNASGGPDENPSHFCLLAFTDSKWDRVLPRTRLTADENDLIPDLLVPADNNITLRNIAVDPSGSPSADSKFFVNNPFPKEAKVTVTYEAPPSWTVNSGQIGFGVPFIMAPHEQKKITLHVNKTGDGVLRIIQKTDAGGKIATGGMTYIFGPEKKKPRRPRCCR